MRAAVRRLRDGTLVGALEDVLSASPHRVAPCCPPCGLRTGPAEAADPLQPRGGCGGCTWQHIAYPEQLRLKSSLVTRLVRETVRDAPSALPTLAATPIDSPWGYRQKVHFVFGTRPGRAQLVIGHYGRGSRRIIPVTTCPVHDERGNALAFRFHQQFTRAGLTAQHHNALKSIAVRVAANTPELMATLVLTDEADRRVRTATRRVIDIDRPSSAHVNIHPGGDAYVFGRKTRRIAGSDRLREEIAGVSFLISPTAFFQTNVRAAEILVRLVAKAIEHRGRILDLYAGAGLFALPLAQAGHDVVAVEENHQAVADGEASRRLNGISEQQARFVARRVEDALRLGAARLAQNSRPEQSFDVVVLDPPREGCSPGVVDGIFRGISPPLAIYVSCNPEALARDLREIKRVGYEVRSLQPVDMFPHTAHVETVAVLHKQASASTKSRST